MHINELVSMSDAAHKNKNKLRCPTTCTPKTNAMQGTIKNALQQLLPRLLQSNKIIQVAEVPRIAAAECTGTATARDNADRNGNLSAVRAEHILDMLALEQDKVAYPYPTFGMAALHEYFVVIRPATTSYASASLMQQLKTITCPTVAPGAHETHSLVPLDLCCTNPVAPEVVTNQVNEPASAPRASIAGCRG